MACEIGPFPLTYLALPLGIEYKAEEVWNRVREKVRKLAYAILVHRRKANTNHKCFGQYSNIYYVPYTYVF